VDNIIDFIGIDAMIAYLRKKSRFGVFGALKSI
jgi:hypothetical protein